MELLQISVKMASLMESYEQQYSSLTAEIVSKIGRIPNQTGSEKQKLIGNVDGLLNETRELLEQMELEAMDQGRDKQKYLTRLKSYKAEMIKLEKDLKKSRIAFSDEVHTRDELLGNLDGHQSEDQRACLLDNSERLERTGNRLDQGYKTCIETEQMGAEILGDLHSQRNQVQRSRERLREANEGLGKSSRILSGMMKRIIQNRILLVAMAIFFVVVIGITIYFATKKTS